MRFDIDTKALAVATGGLGLITALTLGTPSALASPVTPTPPAPPPPAPVAAQTVAAPPAQPVAAAPAPAPAAPPAAEEVSTQAAAPVEGTPHLSSPENLPPDTTLTPVSRQGSGLTYLRELWHAVRTQEVSGEDALLLLTQRPLSSNATPPPGMSANPTPPQPVTAPAPTDVPPAAAPAPAPAP